MKIGHPPNYYVQVFPDSWDQEDAEAPLYEGIFTLSLNMVVSVRFIPDVSELGPPWRLDLIPDKDAEFSTAAQARSFEVLTSEFSVTPNAAMAGQVEEIATPDGGRIVFYVTPAEFATYEAELVKLTDIASGTLPSVRRDDVLDRAVIRFVDERVLEEPTVKGRSGKAVGKIPETKVPPSEGLTQR